MKKFAVCILALMMLTSCFAQRAVNARKQAMQKEYQETGKIKGAADGQDPNNFDYDKAQKDVMGKLSGSNGDSTESKNLKDLQGNVDKTNDKTKPISTGGKVLQVINIIPFI
jgi:hypothetical protein